MFDREGIFVGFLRILKHGKLHSKALRGLCSLAIPEGTCSLQQLEVLVDRPLLDDTIQFHIPLMFFL